MQNQQQPASLLRNPFAALQQQEEAEPENSDANAGAELEEEEENKMEVGEASTDPFDAISQVQLTLDDMTRMAKCGKTIILTGYQCHII